MQLNYQHLSEHCLHKWADPSGSAPGNIKSFSQVCGHPLAPSGMVTLDLLPIRTHTCNEGGLRESVESQGGQIRARRVKAATRCICWLLQRQLQAWLEGGQKRASGCALPAQDAGGAQMAWRMTEVVEMYEGAGAWVEVAGLAMEGHRCPAAWSRIKVQMPTEEFLQKNSTVIAMYRSCLGYSFSKCSL